MSRPGVHLTFSGIDGCGKSTQVERLIERYEAMGLKPVRVWSRVGYTWGVTRLKELARLVARGKLPEAGESKERTEALSRRWVAELWVTVAILDLYRLYGAQMRWWRFRGRPVLCDRYLWDALIDFKMAFPQVDVESKLLWRVLKQVASAPDRQFLLDIDPVTGQKRGVAKNDPWTEPMETRRRREALYRELIADGVFEVLDGGRPADEVFAAIEARVFGK